MKQGMYKNLLFDLDGTLIDPYEGIKESVIYSLSQMKIEVKDLSFIRTFIGPPLYESYRRQFKLSESECQQAISYFRAYYKDQGIYKNSLYAGVKDLIVRLYEHGYHLYLATSKLQVFAERIMDEYQLSQYFQLIGGSLPDGERIEKEDVIAYIIERCQLDKRECLMIGDRKHDVIGAGKNGIDALAITYGYSEANEFDVYPPRYIIDEVKDLERFLIN